MAAGGGVQQTATNGPRVRCEIHRCRSGWGIGNVGERGGKGGGKREGVVFLCPTTAAILGPICGDVCSVAKSSCGNEY